MPLASFATRAYDSTSPGLPEQRAVNVFVSPTPAGPTKFALLQRWGLVLGATDSSGPIRGVLQQAGIFSGDRFAVSGSHLYRNGADLGAVGASGIARLDASNTQLGLVDGGKFYIYDGASLVWIQNDKTASPLPAFIGVIFLAERFVLLCANGTFYWSDVDDGTLIDALSFATAESSPDGAMEIAKLGDEFAILGGTSVEWWFITGASDAPYQRSSNRTYSRGCAAQGSVAQGDNGLVFVGDDRIVYRTGLQPQAISTHGLEQRLSNCSNVPGITSFQITFAGHPFYVLNIPGQGTFAYDFSTKEWSEWTSYGRTIFRCAWGVMYGGAAVMGDDTTGQVWTLLPGHNTDGVDQIERIGSVFIPQPFGVSALKNLTLVGAKGAGADKQVSIRASNNGVSGWTAWIPKTISGTDAGNMKVRWMGGFGQITSPGAFIEIRTTDDIEIAYSGLIYNEARP